MLLSDIRIVCPRCVKLARVAWVTADTCTDSVFMVVECSGDCALVMIGGEAFEPGSLPRAVRIHDPEPHGRADDRIWATDVRLLAIDEQLELAERCFGFSAGMT